MVHLNLKKKKGLEKKYNSWRSRNRIIYSSTKSVQNILKRVKNDVGEFNCGDCLN